MSKYQVIARKYRPQAFREVVGQEAIVATLKNALHSQRIAQAYLFCGSRGTGKTTLARIFAKALNCLSPGADHEPCSQCSSCREIAASNSLDVIEIDGASHRGIDDIRQINETVGYAAANGKYKIYIIDEVHMLTKEAFNALLKTLEEPPEKVKFLFATTEPHKVLPTILSRCQRFNLNRIPIETIIRKLKHIANDLGRSVDDEAFVIIAKRAEGGLRDAESLLDQIFAFCEGHVTTAQVSDILGTIPTEMMFLIDEAAQTGNLAAAFEISQRLYADGKDPVQFLQGLSEHIRTVLHVKLLNKNASQLAIPEGLMDKYMRSAAFYTQENGVWLLDELIKAIEGISHQHNAFIFLESLLLKMISIRQRLPAGLLIKKLGELEEKLGQGSKSPPEMGSRPLPPSPPPQQQQQQPVSAPAPYKEVEPPVKVMAKMVVDPIPTAAEMGIAPKKNLAPAAAPASTTSRAVAMPTKERQRFETILQFAAVELEGHIQL